MKPPETIETSRLLLRLPRLADAGAIYQGYAHDPAVIKFLSAYKADLGYGLARAFQGRRFATEAAKAVVAWALAQPDIYRVWAVCDVENTASAHVLEKAGMQREGILRCYILHPNISEQPRDVFCYSIVKN